MFSGGITRTGLKDGGIPELMGRGAKLACRRKAEATMRTVCLWVGGEEEGASNPPARPLLRTDRSMNLSPSLLRRMPPSPRDPSVIRQPAP